MCWSYIALILASLFFAQSWAKDGDDDDGGTIIIIIIILAVFTISLASGATLYMLARRRRATMAPATKSEAVEEQKPEEIYTIMK